MRDLLRQGPVLLIVVLCSCGAATKITEAVRSGLQPGPPAVESRKVVGGSVFFRLDVDWKRRHPEWDGHYGVVHYYDYNGNGVLDMPDEAVNLVPKSYPGPYTSYTPQPWERPARLRAKNTR